MIYHFEYYIGDYDDKSLILKEMSEAFKNNKLDEFLNKIDQKFGLLKISINNTRKNLANPMNTPL